MRWVHFAGIAALVIAAVGLWLRARPVSAESAPTPGGEAMLMEMGMSGAAVTLVALGDGTASLYFSSGGGVIGGGPHPSINAAARRLVELSGRHASELSLATEFPLPGNGNVTFYVLTTSGVLRGGAPEAALRNREHRLSELFFAGHDVITGLREVTQERRP